MKSAASFTSTAGTRFIVRTALNGEPASGANGGTLGFLAHSREEVHAWHAAGLATGGTDIKDPPGLRNATAEECSTLPI